MNTNIGSGKAPNIRSAKGHAYNYRETFFPKCFYVCVGLSLWCGDVRTTKTNFKRSRMQLFMLPY